KSVDNLKELKALSINDLNKVKGVGLYKALILKAAFELGERIHSGSVDDKIQITSPKDVADFMMGQMEHLKQEKFIVLFLNYKNIILKAAIEIGERIHSGSVDDKIQITSTKDVADFMMGQMEHLKQEKFIVLFLNSKNIVIKKKTIFIGTLNASIVHPREIF